MELVYIAHPLNGDGSRKWGRFELNTERYLRFTAMAMNQGHAVLSWYHHAVLQARKMTPDVDLFYLDKCKELVLRATQVWQCGPLEVSKGMTLEIMWAVEAKIPIIHRRKWDDPTYWP